VDGAGLAGAARAASNKQTDAREDRRRSLSYRNHLSTRLAATDAQGFRRAA